MFSFACPIVDTLPAVKFAVPSDGVKHKEDAD